MSESKPDTVPGLGFKDKEKALDTLKVLEGRDPDYQRLSIKGLIGRAKRTLTLTKDKEKVQNINDAVKVFEDFLRDFEINNLSKENRAYLPVASTEVFLPLKEKYGIEDEQIDGFLDAYSKKAKGDYKNLRTISSGDEKPTWDIVRNAELKKLLKAMEESRPDLWEDDLPTKEHLELILWAYSPDASKIKKNLDTYASKLGTSKKVDSENDEEMNDDDDDKEEEEEKESEKKPEKNTKRKSSGDTKDESPEKKQKKNEDDE
ncbi:spliceosome-associated protein CWC27 homolog [Diorhabda carinulata]|uniref:spliceosome-associated protein CWC27 homolog n=1 Tax=Diorhabda carinulata TaxID=1163345 RepID=UPI0025A2A88C|nr:spliceosome-associated protein CWC27 homolog [Diorhabda carinulata]